MLSTICSAKQKSLQMCAELLHCLIRDGSRTESGNEFHSDGPETEKLLCPRVSNLYHETPYQSVDLTVRPTINQWTSQWDPLSISGPHSETPINQWTSQWDSLSISGPHSETPYQSVDLTVRLTINQWTSQWDPLSISGPHSETPYQSVDLTVRPTINQWTSQWDPLSISGPHSDTVIQAILFWIDWLTFHIHIHIQKSFTQTAWDHSCHLY